MITATRRAFAARSGWPVRIGAACAALALFALTSFAQGPLGGLREPAWAPDGKRLAVVFLDRLWTILPDGRDARELTKTPGSEREPAYSPDGRQIAYAADYGSGFDLYVVPARGGSPERITSLPGDERFPSWTPDGRLVFAYRGETGQSDLYLVDVGATGAAREPQPLTQSPDDDITPRVSPDGRRVAYVSNRANEDGGPDIWMLRLLDRETAAREGVPRRGGATRLLSTREHEGFPTWSPDGTRLAFYAIREGLGSTWVASVPPSSSDAGAAGGADASIVALPTATPVLASRHGGTLAWSPDGRTLTIGKVPDPQDSYNGNPLRDRAEAPPLFATADAFQLWTVAAPRPVDEGAKTLMPSVSVSASTLLQAYDNVWGTLKRLYYRSGDGARRWDQVRASVRPGLERARTVAALEDAVDATIAAQPLVKPIVQSSGAIVVSAHPLASAAGRQVLERGGNVVDAAVAVAFVLGVVEPDASGIGGDGQAVLFMNGMREPTVVEYKDQTPKAVTLDNPRVFADGRLVSDGPAAANIPGVVAGLDYLHTRYGSGAVSWADLLAPAIRHAEEGFVLDETLPSTVAAGRQVIEKYSAASRLFFPNRQLPRVGDRFVNRDLATTLRTLATEGGSAFYRGSIARRIADDMEVNGGLITFDDLAQYRAIERRPVSARYRNHVLFTGGPPVAAGVSLLEALQVLDHYAPKAGATVTSDADYWHYLIESWKARDRVSRIADPAQWSVDYEEHLSANHSRELFRRIDERVAARFPDDSEEAGLPFERLGSGTTAIVVADAAGNMVAITNTLSTWGGSFYVSRGLGFLYNNHLRANRTTPGTYGHLLPLTRSNTANMPVLAFRERDGRLVPRLALGAAGNAWIPAATYSVLAAVLDGRLSMQQAIEAPRFLVTRDPAGASGQEARVEIEDRFPRGILEALTSRGHKFQTIGRKGELRYGYASGALVDVDAHVVEGGADPRRSHAAVAVDGVRRLTQ